MNPTTDVSAWPFEFIFPSQYQQLDTEFKRHIETIVAGEWMRVQSKRQERTWQRAELYVAFTNPSMPASRSALTR